MRCTLPYGRVSAGISFYTLRAALGATSRKTFSAQNRSTGLRLERNVVGLPALIANNLESFALAASAAALAWTAKVLTARIAARLAALGMSQSAFAVIVLLSFSKRKI